MDTLDAICDELDRIAADVLAAPPPGMYPSTTENAAIVKEIRAHVKPKGWKLESKMTTTVQGQRGGKKMWLSKQIGPFLIRINVSIAMDKGSQSGVLRIGQGRKATGPVLEYHHWNKDNPYKDFPEGSEIAWEVVAAVQKDFPQGISLKFQGTSPPQQVLDKALRWFDGEYRQWEKAVSYYMNKTMPERVWTAYITVGDNVIRADTFDDPARAESQADYYQDLVEVGWRQGRINVGDDI